MCGIKTPRNVFRDPSPNLADASVALRCYYLYLTFSLKPATLLHFLPATPGGPQIAQIRF